jgi:hypothetical protein
VSFHLACHKILGHTNTLTLNIRYNYATSFFHSTSFCATMLKHESYKKMWFSVFDLMLHDNSYCVLYIDSSQSVVHKACPRNLQPYFCLPVISLYFNITCGFISQKYITHEHMPCIHKCHILHIYSSFWFPFKQTKCCTEYFYYFKKISLSGKRV